jgi:hypothetical protein
MWRRDAGNYVDKSTALLLDSNIRNSVCTPAKLPCRRVEVEYEKNLVSGFFFCPGVYMFIFVWSNKMIILQ